jgi:hypothetical protein
MPFQVVYSIYQRRVEVVPLVAQLGVDIVYIPLSLTQFTLEATVLSGNPAEHTFEWELVQDDNPSTPIDASGSPEQVDGFEIDEFGSIVLKPDAGDLTDRLFPGRQFWIYNSGDNDGPYTVASSSYDASPGRTVIVTEEGLANPSSSPVIGNIRLQLGEDVYVTDGTFTLGSPAPTPPPWPDIPLGLNKNLNLYYIYAPSGVAYTKRWRLWIDKGTPNEKYLEILIETFPTDEVTYETRNSPATTRRNYARLGDDLDCRRIGIGTISAGPLALPGEDGTAQIPASEFGVSWSLPSCDGDKIIDYEIQKLVNGRWRTIVSGLSGSPQITDFGPLDAKEFYRIVPTFEQFPGSQYFDRRPSDPFTIDEGGGVANDIVKYAGEQKAKNIVVTDYEVNLISVASTPPQTDDVVYESGSQTSKNILVTDYTVTLISSISLADQLDDVTYANDSQTIRNLLVTDYTVNLIGGGGGG